MNKLRNLLAATTILISSYSNGQENLEPVRGVFNIYDHEIEYYPKIRETLFEGLDSYGEIRFVVFPSFSGEYVVDITADKNGQYFIYFQTAEPSIWYSLHDKKPKVKIIKYKKAISSSEVELLRQIFNKAVMSTKYPEKDVIGLDGTTYYFICSNKSGTIWSPKKGSKMGDLVEICTELVSFVKNKDVNLDEELLNKINLLNEKL